MPRRAITLLLALSLCLHAGISPAERDRNIKSFEVVWSTVRDQHWDPKLGGVNWQAAHDELLPQMEKADSADASREVLTRLLARLGLSHFAVLPSSLYADLSDATSESDKGETGLSTVLVGKAVLVEAVEPASSAALAGVKMGWKVARIGETDIDPVLAKLLDLKPPHFELQLQHALSSKLNGPVGSTVQVEFLDGADHKHSVNLPRTTARGKLSQVGYLPPMRVWLDSHRIGKDIGYIHLNVFLDPGTIMPQFGDAVSTCMQCRGMILDLRGNPGGIGAMAMGMAGWFIDKSGQRLGTMVMRQVTLNFVINSRPEVYNGPLAVLVDGTSASTSEILAGGLKDLGRARVFGTTTAAAALPSTIMMLPNGDGFQYAMANYTSEGGKPLEGIGVKPDVEIQQTREALLAGRDRVLDAATEWIKHHDEKN
jgi:carboxyl-terminal processing protease